MSKDKRDAERAARRARRLAERTEERAKRKERQARRATERAEKLAERVRQRPGRERDIDQSIEDLVDEVTEKAEAWINEQTQKLFDSSSDDGDVRRAEKQARKAQDDARKARESARRAEQAADDLSEVEASILDEKEYDDDSWSMDEMLGMGMSKKEQRKASRSARRRARRRQRHYGYDYWHGMDWGYDDWGRKRKRRQPSAHLYRDRQRKKICGVCAGTADYFGRPAWEIRLYAVLGLIFIPSVTIPAYFIMYFLMDDKPHYRRVTDRIDEGVEGRRPAGDNEPEGPARTRKQTRRQAMQEKPTDPPEMNNVQTMKVAKDKFADIEQRLRQMETHVTSSRFELQRELKKISGEGCG